MLFTFMFVLVDTGLQYLNIYINKWYIAQKDKAVKDQAKKDKTSKSVIRRKVSIYEGTNPSSPACSYFSCNFVFFHISFLFFIVQVVALHSHKRKVMTRS